jgi:hypothetical protein
MHQRDLPGRSAEAHHADLQPRHESVGERRMGGGR